MRALSVSALLLLALNSCRGTQDNFLDEDVIEPVVKASKYGSLWPLPQKVQISEVPLKLSGATFAFTDAKGSTAGPSCSLLQSAYRRYYDYIFGGPKKQKMSRNRRAGPLELTELQVSITSPDSQCDGYPSVTSDESYELSVDVPVAVLKAPTVWGALHDWENRLFQLSPLNLVRIDSTVLFQTKATM